MSKGRTDILNVFQAQPLVTGVNVFETQWPLGLAWYSLILRFNIALTLGTGATALTDALQRIINAVSIITDVDGPCVNNVPGRALYRRAQFVGPAGVAPVQDSFSAATGTYRIQIPIHFYDYGMKRPEDTILDTMKYQTISLLVTMGGPERLLATVGTATVSMTLDADIEYPVLPLVPNTVDGDGRIVEGSSPILYPYLAIKPAINPNNQLFVDLDRSADLGIKRLFWFTSDGSDGSTNSTDSFQGVAQNNILNLVSLEDQNGFCGMRTRIADMVKRHMVANQQIDGGAVPAGWYLHEYVNSGSINDAEATGLKSRYQLTYSTSTLVASSRIHVLEDGVKVFKNRA